MTIAEPDAVGPMLTQTAAAKVDEYIAAAGGGGLALRIAVFGGGCSGPRYQLGLDDRTLDGDVRRRWHGVDVVVDADSAPQLADATIDWIDRDGMTGFTVDAGPGAAGACDACPGC